jgi:NADP-dependent 3-hydroxy acid dehydrogenase YdfG
VAPSLWPECNAVVTGASAGIGRAIALALGRRGFLVHLVGRSRSRLDETAAQIGNSRQAQCYAADLDNVAELSALVNQLAEGLAGLDLLVHSAGAFVSGRFETLPVQDFDRAYSVNVRAPFVVTQTLLPHLRRRSGQVVFINSSSALQPSPTNAAYAASKRALSGLAEALRADVNADDIRVLSVFPGRTATRMQNDIHLREGKTYVPDNLLQPDDIAAAVLNAIELPRTAELTDLNIRPMRKH